MEILDRVAWVRALRQESTILSEELRGEQCGEIQAKDRETLRPHWHLQPTKPWRRVWSTVWKVPVPSKHLCRHSNPNQTKSYRIRKANRFNGYQHLNLWMTFQVPREEGSWGRTFTRTFYTLMDVRGWGVTSIQTFQTLNIWMPGTEVKLPSEQPRLFGYIYTKGWGEAFTQTFYSLGTWMPGTGVMLPPKHCGVSEVKYPSWA